MAEQILDQVRDVVDGQIVRCQPGYNRIVNISRLDSCG